MDCRGVVKECSQSTLKGVLCHRTFGGPSIGPRISTWLRGVCRSRLIVEKWLGWKLIVVRSNPIIPFGWLEIGRGIGGMIDILFFIASIWSVSMSRGCRAKSDRGGSAARSGCRSSSP